MRSFLQRFLPPWFLPPRFLPPWFLPPWFLPRRRPAAHRTGRRGERLAARAVRRAGYRLLARNARTPLGEIDILALDGRCLVLVEVKTTATGPIAAWPVPRAQRERLRSAARWVRRRTRPTPSHVRIDLVTVVLGPGHPAVRIHRGRL